jgi:uncharacterized protein
MTVASMIEDLLDPSSLPDATERVSLIQTHISLVFVGDEFAYKVKKPVNFGFLDFTTLEKRRFFCEQEVRLNNRLAHGLYLGVLPIFWDGVRHRIGEAGGEVVDYAVRMLRIPQEKLMKSMFQRGELKHHHLRQTAEVLARFHKEAETSAEIASYGEPVRFKVNTDENFAQTERYVGKTIGRVDFETLRQWTDRFYGRNLGLFLDRITAGRIRDCHGDLHMEHICLNEKIAMFDCIEFNDRFRYSDAISDIAFLLMDLEFHGGKDFADKLWSYYAELADEKGTGPLLTFYKVYRAYVRGKVHSFQLDDIRISPDEKEQAAKVARDYFRLAREYIE